MTFWILDCRFSIRRSQSKKVLCLALGALLFAPCFPVWAQQTSKIPRIGFLSTGRDPDPLVGAFRRGLRDLGYVDGKNILVEYRYAEGKLDRLPSLVTDLVQLKVNVLVMGSLPAIRAAMRATKTIPIVVVTSVDPVATGLVDSLAHPGGNLTGRASLMRELSAKRFELLKETVPKISRVGILWDAEAEPSTISFKEYEAAARTLRIQIQSLGVRGPNPDFEGAFQAGAKARVDALITISNGLIRYHRDQIARLAIKKRLPSLHERSQYVEAGGLMSYSAIDAEEYRRAAIFVDKILKGAKPADLPVEQPTKFEFVINLKTAKQIGVTIPQSVLFRADKVIK
jgi:putative tryptophan/tyrosine transport system substrate-binding protein